MAANVSANFTKYETEQLLKLVHVFLDFGHYEQVQPHCTQARAPVVWGHSCARLDDPVPRGALQALFDDIADSITYCNHYLAPIKAPPAQLAAAFSAYAKNEHERGDLFMTLARCVVARS